VKGCGEEKAQRAVKRKLSDPGRKRAVVTAAGSAGETRVAPRLAVTWRIVGEKEAARAMELLRRMLQFFGG